jgi:hypothetical protein
MDDVDSVKINRLSLAPSSDGPFTRRPLHIYCFLTCRVAGRRDFLFFFKKRLPVEESFTLSNPLFCNSFQLLSFVSRSHDKERSRRNSDHMNACKWKPSPVLLYIFIHLH